MKLKFLFLSFCLFAASSIMAQTYYVNSAVGSDTNNGTSWTTAFKTLDKALAQVVINTNYKEIRVSKGTYVAPTGDGFIIPAGVNVFGCFNGSDNYNPLTQLPDTLNYKTILKGNGGRVVTQKADFDIALKILWSGFTITGGNAANAITKKNSGGGALIQNSTTFRYVSFVGNTAIDGGGVYNEGGGVLASCVIANNTATNAAGVYNHISRVFNSLIVNNTATGNGGGAILQGGGITNTTITNNTAANGGAIYNANTTGAIKNCIFYDNTAASNPEIYTSTFARLYNSIVKGLTAGSGTANIDSDPMFINRATGNYRLAPCSPAIENGNNTHINDYITESGFSFDLDGKPRKYNTVDIGAYEYQGIYATVNRLYVDASKGSGGDGVTWATAFNNLDDALNLANGLCVNNVVSEIYVAKGTYKPMQKAGNGVENRDKAFVISRGFKIYGGFKGGDNTETPASRNLATNISLLSGLVGNFGTATDSAYHVMVIAKSSKADSILIDGLHITGGRADVTGEILINGLNVPHNYGAGLFNVGAGALTRFSNGKIYNNNAQSGAGVYNSLGAGFVLNSGSIENNEATLNGGGVWSKDATSSFTLSGTGKITGNNARSGGGIYNTASSKFVQNSGIISNNTAALLGGGVNSWNASATMELSGTGIITENTAPRGNEVYIGAGGIFNVFGAPVVGVSATKKGVYMTAGIVTNVLTSIASGAQIMFEAPAAVVAGRTMVTTTTTVADDVLARFTYLPYNYILKKSGTNIILAKLQASLLNYTDVTKVYDGTPQSVVASILPDSLQNYVMYEYTGINYGPTNQAPTNVGAYQVKAYIKDHPLYADIDSTITLTISPREITVTADVASRIYGDNDPTLIYSITSGLLATGDAFTGSLVRAAGSDVGVYPISQGELTISGGAASNYALTFIGNNFSITPRPITVQANNITIYQNDAEPQLTYSIIAGSVVSPDEFTGGLQREAGIALGTYNINQGNLALSNNYLLTFIGGIFTITNKPLSPQTINWNQTFSLTYGDPAVTLNATATSGLPVSYESSDVNVVQITGNQLTVIGVGAVTIKATQDGNGSFYPATPKEITIAILQRQITVKADDMSKTYGDIDPPLTYNITLGSLVSGDNFTGTLSRSLGEDVADYLIGQGNLLLSNNYQLSFNTGNFKINKRSIKVIANGGNSTYGESPGGQGYTIQGLVGGDADGVIAGLSNNITISSTSAANTYTINVTGTLVSPNYILADVDRIVGTWTVKPKEISVTANSGSSTYGSNPSGQGYTVEGLVNNDTQNALSGLAVDLTVNNATLAGNYTINVIGALTNQNYTIVNRNSGTWYVYPKSITVTAIGGNSTYGDSPTNPGLIATGLVNGETLSSLTGLTNSFGITPTTQAGDNTLTVAGILSNNNYSLADNDRIWGIWKVSPKSITVTANGGTSIYGQSPTNPGIKAVGLVNGETESVLANLVNDFGILPITNVGRYTLSVVGELINGNYSITNRASGEWDVTKVSATLAWITDANWTGNNCNLFYDGNPKTVAATVAPINDGVIKISYYNAGSLVELGTAPTNAGTYDIKAELINATNYLADTLTGTLTISKITPTLLWDSTTLTVPYDGTSKSVSATSSNGNTNITYAYKQNGTAVTPVKAGTYDVTATLPETMNYYSASINGLLTISKGIAHLVLQAKSTPYTGLPISITPVTASGAEGASLLTVEYKYDGSLIPPTDAGNYTVVASTLVTDDFDSVESAPVTLTITQAEPIINLISLSRNYDGSPVAIPTPVVGGSSTSQNLALSYFYTGIDGGIYASSTPPTDAGKYIVSVRTEGDKNHFPASAVANLRITEHAPLIELEDKTVAYTGSPISISPARISPVEASGFAVTYKYTGLQSSGLPYLETMTPPTHAGDYIVVASTEAQDNFEEAVSKASLIITKSPSLITAYNKTTKYTGSPIGIEPAVTIPEGASLTYNYKGVDVNYDSSTSPTDAGTYVVTVSFDGDTNHESVSATANLIIKSGVPSLSLKNKTAIYTGTAISIDPLGISPSNEGIVAEYFYVGVQADGTSYPSSSTAPINSGMYTVTVVTKATNNYTSGTITALLTIERAKPTLLWDSTTLTASYDGTAKSVSATSSNGDTNIIYAYKQNGTAVTPVKAGAYDVAAILPETMNYFGAVLTGMLDISKIAPVLTWHNASLTAMYDGTTKAVLATSNNGDTNINYTYKQNGNDILPINSGTYDVTANLPESTNYLAATLAGKLIIGKTTPTLTWHNASLTAMYNGTTKAVSATSNNGDTNINYTYKQNGNDILPINAGTYDVTANLPESTNYLAATLAGKLIIGKATPTLTWNNASLTAVYNGKAKSVSAIASNGDNANIHYSYTQNGTAVLPINAGTYNVIANLPESANYLVANLTGSLTIGKAIPILTWDEGGLNAIYDGRAKSALAFANNGDNNIFYSYKQSGNAVEPINAGKYDVTADLPESANYFAASLTGIFTISKSSVSLIWSRATLTTVYDGTQKSVTAIPVNMIPKGTKAGTDNITYTYSQNGASVSPINAGKYDITATLVEGTNQLAVTITGVLTITKAKPVLVLQPKTVVYTGAPVVINSTTAIGVTGASDLRVDYKYNGSTNLPINAGVYSVVANTVADINFETVSSQPVTLTITKANPVINVINLSKNYSGTPIAITQPTIGGSATSGNLSLTYFYESSDGGDYSSSNPPINRGTYAVTVSTSGDNNHNSAIEIASLIINQNAPILELDNKTAVYTGQSVSINPARITTAEAFGFNITYKYSGVLNDGSIYSETTTPPTNAGNYVVTASTEVQGDFEATRVTATLTINKSSTLITAKDKVAIYTASPINIDAVMVIPTNVVLAYNYKGVNNTYNSPNAPTNAGNYTLTISSSTNNNYESASTTVNLIIQPAIANMLLKDKTATYNGRNISIDPVTINPSSLTLEVSYTYSGILFDGTIYPETTNAPIDAGVYTVVATSIATNNHAESTTTARLTIQRAFQNITFAALPQKFVGDADFSLNASVSSGLPLTFTSTNENVAVVNAQGIVSIIAEGQTTIRVAQLGNNNYLPAVIRFHQLLVELSTAPEPVVTKITIGSEIYNSPNPANFINYILGCDDGNNVTIDVTADVLLTIEPSRSFEVTFDKPKIIQKIIKAKNADGRENDYIINIEKRFTFDDVVVQKWNNVLMLDLKKLREIYGYTFESYKWYRANQLIGTGTYYSAGNRQNDNLVEGEQYWVEMIMNDGTVLRTCPKVVILEDVQLFAYPNPVVSGGTATVKINVDENLLNGAIIEVYDMIGRKVITKKAAGSSTLVTMPSAAGMYVIYLRNGQELKKTFKIVVE